MYKSLIVTDIRSLNGITDEKLCIFVECPIDTNVLFKLLELVESKDVLVFKAIRNKLATIDLFVEQKLIIENIDKCDELEMENYIKYDIYNSQFDEYLLLDDLDKEDEVETKISDVRTNLLNNTPDNVISSQWLLADNNGNFVVEKYEKINEQLNSDINNLFHVIDASFIVITADHEKFYTCQDTLLDSDRVVAKSSNIVNNKYFFIPDSKSYTDPQKFVLINDYDFKFAFNNLMNGDYIIGFKDNLRYSNYFIDSCKSFKVSTSLDYINVPNLYINQEMDSIALINLVIKFGKLDIFEIKNNQIVNLGTVYKSSDEFRRFIIDYKNTMFNKQVEPLNLRVLFAD